MMFKQFSIFTILLLFSFCASSQKTEVNFTNEIKELNTIGKNIIRSSTRDSMELLNIQFKAALLEVINSETAFDYNFDVLKTISILKANELKIYNWALPYPNGTFKYFAFVTTLRKENYKVVELIDKSESIKSPTSKILMPKMWYGALYYKIIHHKKIGENYYTFLGWDGNNKLTNKKIIDVIQVTSNNTIKIGAPIFKMEKKTQKRVIFEYTDNAVMSLKYHPKLEKIVFDYLVPSNSSLKGIYEYYGPALKVFDALILDKKQWVFEHDVNILLDKSVKDHMWTDPNGE